MYNPHNFLRPATLALCSALPWLLGCEQPSATPAATTTAEHGHDEHGHDHGHTHSGDDSLVWGRSDVEQAGYQIKLGHHSQKLHSGEEIEPAVSISRDGQAVADAQVFNSLQATGGAAVLAAEVATVYEPETADEPAHYAQGALQVPAGTEAGIIRFRIGLPAGVGEHSFDLPVTFEPHTP